MVQNIREEDRYGKNDIVLKPITITFIKALTTQGKYEKRMFYYIETGQPKEAVGIWKKVQKLLEPCDDSELWRADNLLNMGQPMKIWE